MDNLIKLVCHLCLLISACAMTYGLTLVADRVASHTAVIERIADAQMTMASLPPIKRAVGE